MKINLLSIACLLSLSVLGQGFPSNATNWGMPNGGKLSGGSTYGYNNFSSSAFPSDNTGSQSWDVLDMNGDGLPDLVVTAQLQGNDVTCFSPGLNQYWNVYLNDGNGFSTSATVWSLPNGGRVSNAIIYGFDNLYGTASTSHNSGSQSWIVTDMNGDNKPDLVVLAQLQGGNVTCFSPGSGQYWKVYLNTGSGFSSTVTNWDLPNGGKIKSGITYGYNEFTSEADQFDNTGSQTWSLLDMDGDSKLDLVVNAQLQGGNVTCFSPGSNQYWKVYANTGTGFSASATNWDLPNGGKLSGGTTYGYNTFYYSALSFENTGSQSWAVADINGDKKPDLIVTAQLQAGNVTCFSPGSNQYWKVYLNGGSSFSTSSMNWNLPNGGRISGGITYGFDQIYGTAQSSDNTGSQSWMLEEMDGCCQMELVVTAQLQAGEVTCFSPGNDQYWKVYANIDGFNGLPINCALPAGGRLSQGTTYGFNSEYGVASSSNNTGSQSWGLIDMNGDKIIDLVVTAQLQGGLVSSFSPASEQYWKVYTSDFVTGINELSNSQAKTYKVYPNPNNGSFTLKSSSEEIITISNELGQLVKTVELKQLTNFTTNVSGLENGVYFISGKNTRAKIIVLN